MSYEVTATRRRPQRFDDLVGQEFVAETLKNSIKSGKIAHAYLFSGPRGCGKTSTARILAKALNCQDGPTDVPCGNCSNCQEITRGSSLDVIEIDGASNTGVENIRQIKDEVLFPPSKCRYKIYIIDEVHMLSNSAFNALLKTIEEPPEYVIFIFATTELQKVPATIKSRCQQFNFRLVAVEQVKQCLKEAADEINVQAEDEALYWIARESTGSMRDAYTLFDQVVAFSDGHITYEKIRDKLGLVGIDRLNVIFEACAKGDSKAVIDIIDNFLQAGVSIEQLISNSADYLRSLLLIKSGVTKEALLGNSVERYSAAVLNAWNAVQIERALSVFLQLYRDIRYSLSPRYELELAFSRLCWLKEYVSNAEVKKAIDAAQSLLCGGAPAGANAPSRPAGGSAGVNGSAGGQAQSASEGAAGGSEGGFAGAGLTEAGQAGGSEGVSANENADSAGNVTIGDVVVPEGLPVFSSLSTMADDDEEMEEGAEQNPFYDGGPLPPEQSVEQNAQAAVSESQSENESEPKEIDSRLQFSGLQENQSAAVQTQTQSTAYYVPKSEGGYSANPDSEEDDGWTNTDEPPMDDYYVDDETMAQQAEESYEASKNEQPFAQETKQTAQLNDMISLSNGGSISVAQLRGSITAAFGAEQSFLANVLEKTGEWSVNETSVNTTVQTPYDKTMLEKSKADIAQEISKILGRQMAFNVELKQSEKQEIKAEELPGQVNLLLDAFKGTIIGR